MDAPSPEQTIALDELGIESARYGRILMGEVVVFSLRTESELGIAILQVVEGRLRAGIVELNDPAGGLKTLLRFRNACRRLANTLHLTTVELYGVEVINPILDEILRRQGFVEVREPCPDELGDAGDMTILTRTFDVRA